MVQFLYRMQSTKIELCQIILIFQKQNMTSLIDPVRKCVSALVSWSCQHIAAKFVNPDKKTPKVPECAIEVPEGQRNLAQKWKQDAKKEQLTDSIMHGIPIQSCIVVQNTNGTFHVYDGRHRMQTIQAYKNGEYTWKGKKYSELSPEDKATFDAGSVPIWIVQGPVDNNQLAEIFLRVNAGVPLRDSDMFWAYRESPLVSMTRELLVKNARLKACLGGLDLASRNDLANYCGLVYGLVTGNASNMTNSYVRISGDKQAMRPEAETEAYILRMTGGSQVTAEESSSKTVNGLNYPIKADEANVTLGLDAYCHLLETANLRHPSSKPEMRSYKKIGKIAAFFFTEWLQATTEAAKSDIVEKWVEIIRRLRNEPTQNDMLNALSVTGAQNLNQLKITKVLDQVNKYLSTGVAAQPIQADVEEEE